MLEYLLTAERQRMTLWIVMLSLVTMLTIRSHITYGTLGVALIYSVTAIRLLSARFANQRRELAASITMSFVLGVCLSLSLIVPVIAERSLVQGFEFGSKGFSLGTVGIEAALLPYRSMRSGNPNDLYIGYVGLSTVVLAVMGGVWAILRRQQDSLWLGLMLGAGLLLTFGPHYSVIDAIVRVFPLAGVLYAGKSSGFYFLYVLLPLCGFAGMGVEGLTATMRKLWNLQPQCVSCGLLL
jgi:hypothetical protein